MQPHSRSGIRLHAVPVETDGDTIESHIRRCLTTPRGADPVNEALGVEFLARDGTPTPNVEARDIVEAAHRALFVGLAEPEASRWLELINQPVALVSEGRLLGISVEFFDPDHDEMRETIVAYGTADLTATEVRAAMVRNRQSAV